MTSQLDAKPVEQIQTQPEARGSIPDNKEEIKNNQPEVESQPKNSKEWDNFRAKRNEDRKRADEMDKLARKSQEEAAALKAALEAVLNKTSPQHYQQEEIHEETQEQIIDRRVAEAISKREAESSRIRREQEQAELPNRIASNMRDFDQVCSQDNLDYLEYHYPEVAKAFSHMPQSYDKWESIYKAVKRFIPNSDSKKDQAKADKNFQKPQSASSPGVTHNGNSAPTIRLDEKKKAENYARMQRVMNKLD